ncbi:MAG TPA: protein kinase [Kofleriaceae bacterium]|nr:protein kinase [Kofleriaceae bacterium]
MLGQSLGSYTIERELGRGGMGAVYAAVHGLLGRRAAVKVLLPELSRNQDHVQRFFNEARAATAINHPSIVEIYDFGWSPDGSAYIVMELMDGESLSARLRRLRRLPVANALTVARQIANALAAAHKAGIVHRDLKPDNVFLVPDIEVAGGERVKLLDFGIAKLAADGGVSRTTTGAIMGTPLYMSPEQCEGARQVDHRTDLYALGCILFEMITGRVPFVHEGVGGLIGMHLYVAPPELRSLAPEAPAEVEAIVARLLAKKPDERFQTADELSAALARAGATSLPPGHIADTIPGPSPSPSPYAPVSGFDRTMPSAPGAPTTLSSAASARMNATEPDAPRARGPRGLFVAIAAIAVATAGVITVVALSRGGDDTRTNGAGGRVDAAVVVELPPSSAFDAAVAVPDPPIDGGVAAGSMDAALERLREHLAQHQWVDARRELDAIYDGTQDGDSARSQADDLIAFARPHAIDEAKGKLTALIKDGDCKAAKKLAAHTVEMWGDGAEQLVKVVAKCKPRSTPAPTPDPAPPKPPEPEPTPEPPVPVPEPGRLAKEVIQRVLGRAKSRVAACAEEHGMSGTVVVRMTIEPSGEISSATIARGGDSGPGDACVGEVISRLRFPASDGQTTINYPFAFRAAPKY